MSEAVRGQKNYRKMKTHWKQLCNPDYIGAYALPEGQDLVVKIVRVERQIVTSTNGKKEECTVALLDGQKPFILNRTNSKTITQIYGSPYIEDWAGKYIQLFAAKTRLAGDDVECLRIRPQAPNVQKPTLTREDTTNYTNVLLALRNGYTFEQIATKWNLTQEVKLQLQEDANAI